MCVGRAEYVLNPGDYFAFDLLGDMLIIVRDEHGEVVLSQRHTSVG